MEEGKLGLPLGKKGVPLRLGFGGRESRADVTSVLPGQDTMQRQTQGAEVQLLDSARPPRLWSLRGLSLNWASPL